MNSGSTSCRRSIEVAWSTYCTGMLPRRPPKVDCCCTKARALVFARTAADSSSAISIWLRLRSGNVLQGDADIAPAARHAGRRGLGFGDERIDQAVDVLGVVADVFVGRALRAAGVDRDLRAVLERGHLRGDRAPEQADQHDHRADQRQGDPAAAQEGRQRTAVEIVEADEERLGLVVEPALALLPDEELGGEHRGHREGPRKSK